jgi:hypothetical protein
MSSRFFSASELVMTATLSDRLQRLYAAIGEVIDKDDVKNIKPQFTYGPDGSWSAVRWNFSDGMTTAELANKAWTAIHNTATLYNHCRTWAQRNGIAADEVDAVTANCLALRIIRDLDNSDKHPEARPNTSGLSPKLQNVTRALRITAPPGGQVKVFVPIGGGVSGEGASLAIVGAVVNDRNGQVVHRFPEVIEEGLAAWEAFLRSKNVLK